MSLVTFDQFNASLLNESINFFKKKRSDSKRLNGSFSLSFNRVEDTSISASLVWKCAHDGSTAKSS